jgi:hypothetical protein
MREQFMRTLSAVRTRLRGPVPDDHGELEPPHAYGGAATNGNGQVARGEHVAAADGGVDASVNGGQAGPVDPLLADPYARGRTRPRARRSIVTAAAVTDAVEVDDPGLTVPLVDPVTEPLVEPPGPPTPVEPRPPRPSRVKQTRVRVPRVRPALPLLRRRPRVRKVTRIVRKVDAWGVFKISLVFYVILYIILLVAGVLLWNLANTTGTVANVEGFARDLFGLKTFEFDGEKLFRASWVLGAILVVAGTGFNVTMAVLFNLISDLVGGVRVSVLEEEVVLRERPVVPRRTEASANESERAAGPASNGAGAGHVSAADWSAGGGNGDGAAGSAEAEATAPMEPMFDMADVDLPPPEVIDADGPPPGTV